jgi:hypothetical protein
VAVLDANCNFRLGDRPATRVLSGTNWYFTGGDMMLLDANNSGAYESSVTSTESCLFSSLLYDGPTPYKFALAADSKSIRLEPCPAPLAEVSLQPMGDQVQNITFAWEETKDQWQMVRAGAARGKVLAPPGNYRLYGCDLFTGGSGGQTVFAKGYKRAMQPTLAFRAGANNALQCGAPLQVNVTASNTRSASTAAGSGLVARVSSLVRTPNGQDTVRINAVVTGRGGETYSSYSMGLAGERPPKPTFTILGMNGKEAASGNLEFG